MAVEKSAPGSARRPSLDTSQIYRDLTILIYPSVLGSIVYHFMEVAETRTELTSLQLSALILLLSIIYHYCVDYLYTIYFETYNIISLLLDLIVVGILCYCTTLINLETGARDTKTIAFLFAFTYLLFIAIDLVTLGFSWACWKVVAYEAIVAAYFVAVCATRWSPPPLIMAFSIAIAGTVLFHIAPKPVKKKASSGRYRSI